ncbi:MAG: 2-oxo acid dehydrogenase subunit E2, partial [Planctomycetota bacterium]
MPISVTMPRMSDTMEAGTVVKWHKSVGDEVMPGDVLADIETDKATMELEAFDEGTIAKLAVEEGSNVSVGDLIVIIAEEGESVEDAAASAGSASAAPKAKQADAADEQSDSNTSTATALAEPPAQEASPTTSNGSTNGRVFASPLARKIAAEKNIDLGAIRGSGPSGRIVKKDVEQAQPGQAPAATPAAAPAAASAPAPAPMPTFTDLESKNVPLSNMRGVIARRLVESKTTIPHYQVTVSARLDDLMDLRKQLNTQLETQGVKLSVNDFLVRACGLAMHQHPFVNSAWRSMLGPLSFHEELT